MSSLQKQSLSTALDILWTNDPPPELEKTAAAYLYDIRKPEIDCDMLGDDFCKLALSFERDPWDLAEEVEANIDLYQALTKTSSSPKVLELAHFYNDWADETIEKSAIIGRLAGGIAKGVGKMFGGGARQAAKQVTKAGRTAAVGTPGQIAKQTGRAVPKATRKAMTGQVATAAKQKGGRRLAGQQASVRKTAPGMTATKSPAQQAQLKTTLQKRQASRTTAGGAQARPVPQPAPKPAATTAPAAGGAPAAPAAGAVPAKKPMFSTKQKLIGAGVVAAPVMGAASVANQMNQPRRGQF